MTMRILLSGCFCCLLLTSSGYAQGNTRDFGRVGPAAERAAYFSQVRTELNDLLIHWKRAFESDDAAALARFYAEETAYHPANAAQLVTRSSIQEFFVSHLRTVADVELHMVGFGTSGDLAYVTARMTQYTHTSTGGIKPVVSTELFVFRRHNGRTWQIESQLSQVQPQDRQLP
jgi:ketosteroid isomerase-like protein